MYLCVYATITDSDVPGIRHRNRDFMMFLSDDKQADVIDAFNTTSRYLDDI